MFTDAIGNAGYSLLKDLRAEIEVKDGTFSLCFWVYLANSTTFPATIIQQVCSDVSESAPFLVINDHKRINLLPLLLLHEEAPDTGNINSLTEVAYATVDFEFPLQNWVHIGCEVCPNHMKLQINGEIVGEKPLSSNKEPSSNDLRKIVLANIGGDGNISHDYVYNFQVFPSVSSIKDHHMKVIGMKEYEERAVSLALSRPKLQALTNKLKSVRMTCLKFDTARWVRNLERGYLKMWNLHCSGQRPQHFKVTENDLEYPYVR